MFFFDNIVLPGQVPDEEYTLRRNIKVPGVNDILKMMERGAYKISRHELLSDVFECGAIAVSNKFDFKNANQREEKYLNIMKKHDKDTRMLIQELFAMIYALLSSQIYNGFADYLGELYMSSETSNSRAGQFFTPYNISKACAECLLDENIITQKMTDDEILTLNEPSCGSGGMIIAAVDKLYNHYHFNISRNLFVECSDIDSRCVHMCYLQLGLAGVPAVIYKQNTLTLETWEEWFTPAYLMHWQRFERHREKMKRRNKK